MKKTALLLVATAALFASCNKKNTPGFDVNTFEFDTYHWVGTTNTSKCNEFSYAATITNKNTQQDTTVYFGASEEVTLNINKGEPVNVLIYQDIACKDYMYLEKSIDLE